MFNTLLWEPLQQVREYAIDFAQVAFEFVLLQLIIAFFIARNVYYALFGYPYKQIRGQLVVITGAGQGLGRELAFQFAKQETIVALVDIDKQKVDEVHEELKQAFPAIRTDSYQLDVSNSDQIRQVFEKISNDFGAQIDILVNNAAVVYPTTLLNNTEERIRRTFEVNALSNFWTVRQVLPSMIDRKRGHILSIASMAGFMGCANMIDYSSSKFAIVGMMESLRSELDGLGHEQIKTTTVCPGMMSTGMFQKLTTRFPRLLPITSPRVVAEKAVLAVLHDQEMIFVPGHIYPFFYLPRMCLPLETRKYVSRFISCKIGSHDDKK